MLIFMPRVMPSKMLRLCLLLCSALFFSSLSFAQGSADYEKMKAEARTLYEQGRLTDILPLAEKLYAINPKDIQVLEFYAMSTLAYSQTLKDPNARKAARKKVYDLAVKAKALGDNSNLLSVYLDMPPDGSEAGFSNRKEVDAAMQEAESAFAKGDYKKALTAYNLALQLDPKLYTAALFSGDVYYKQGDAKQAGEWFAKAIAIDPEIETAYRYWGDVLMNVSNDKNAASEKFIDAILAQPYDRRAWMGLIQWSQKYGVRLGHPKIVIPTSVEKQPAKDGKDQTNITLDVSSLGKKDGSAGWLMYGISRSSWMNEKFLKEYPSEKKYRHSLREEVEALHMVIEGARNDLKDNKGTVQLDVSLANLFLLDKEGLLEAFILIGKPDDGIAQDYAAYRKTNRDKLRKYMTSVVLNGGQVGK